MKLEDLGLKLEYKELENSLGYFDERTATIVINSNQSEFEKDVILIHEFLHATATQLKQLGVIKKQPDHAFITNCSQQLLALFVASDKWTTKHNIKVQD